MTVLLGVLAALPLLVGTASASGDAARKNDQINAFVDRVHKQWGYTIDPDDYTVVEDTKGTLIARKDQAASTNVVVTRAVSAKTGKLEAAVKVTPPRHFAPSVAERRAQEQAGKAVLEQDIKWYEPYCEQFTSNNGDYGEPIGYAANCGGWGSMDYVGATMANWAFKQTATCIADWDPTHASQYELTECGVHTYKWAGADPWTWHGWEPASDMNQSNCTQVSLSVAAGPVSGGMTFNACDLIDMEVGAAPQHDVVWRGEKAGNQRQAAQLIAIGTPWGGQNPDIGVSYGYRYHRCGYLGELCD